MTAACGYVNCKVEFQNFIRKVCVFFMNKQYLKYKFFGISSWKWIGLNVKEEHPWPQGEPETEWPQVNMQGFRVSLQVSWVSIQGSTVSLHGSKVSLHGSRVSLNVFRWASMSLRGPWKATWWAWLQVSMQSSRFSMHGSRVSLNG